MRIGDVVAGVPSDDRLMRNRDLFTLSPFILPTFCRGYELPCISTTLFPSRSLDLVRIPAYT